MRGAVVLVALALAGCPKSNETSTSTSDAAPPRAASASASASSAAAPAAAPKPTTWSVKYAIAEGTLYIPDSKDWSATKFKNDKEKFLGEGTLSLTADPSGRVSGASEGGPLGNATFDGRLDDGALTATIRRKDPSDSGLTGTLVAKIDGETLEGQMKLAESNAAVVRVAKVSGTKAK